MKDRNDRIRVAVKGNKPMAVEGSDESDQDLDYEREYDFPKANKVREIKKSIMKKV